MLDAETKRKIDNARDILVGKVPDPKSQVEQITIALIYKFMDDMDRESEELGGKASFFTGEYKKYSWSKIFDPKLGGFDLIALYGEAIAKMNTNKNIPQLFRDIFKNAFLPYRDPETLKSFLKEINDFRYDHSERLGDAFEYLLSVLGSQGEAGQFRTPRHIIDFIVAVVDPKKGETVLDPAGGTAGFLISSYKHILKANTSPEALKSGMNGSFAGDLLTPDDRKRIMDSFEGYDISPDMVRLSLVNMYLHGFPSPRIHEYDTLTSEDRWGESFDVILANPPFMTPKGGIRPHKRFSIQANRSEVLFVDYIAEHIATTGRAGVIVPEGIIFQSANAYKSLRKMLIEQNYLWAVISLPAGVFNPYSGVKTSILFMDKALAKKTNDILFIKIEHDGFDLGAQRRPNGKDDLPSALDVLRKYKKSLSLPDSVDGVNALLVSKSRIAENGDYNLSGERYREYGTIISSFPIVPISSVAAVVSGFGFPVEEQGILDHAIPFLKVSDMNLPQNHRQILQWNNTVSRETLDRLGAKSFPAGTVIFPKIGAAIATNKKRILTCESTFDNNVMGIVPSDRLLPNYLFAIMQTIDLLIWASEAQPPSMRKSVVEAYGIPLPSIEVQKEIVAEIEGYQKIIDGARQVVENWRPSFSVDPDWPLVELGEVCEVISGQSPEGEFYNDRGEGTPFYQGKTEFSNKYIGSPHKWTTRETKIAEKDDILMSVRAPVGPVNISTQRICIGRGLAAIRASEKILIPFLFALLRNKEKEIKGNGGAVFDSINRKDIESIRIPLPPLEVQHEFVARIEEEQKLVDSNNRLIDIYEAMIKSKIDEVWGS